ncbi:MAG TPA: acetate--CoA ligase family protein [Rhodothermia bacterium]|nr:acetate--CoA ligase family protein [Rhodothermia bacterium]
MSGVSPPGALDGLLKPASIAVIGASRQPNTIGHQIVSNLVAHGFTGPVYPVNPRATAVNSMHAWPNLASLPTHVDCAIVCVPREHVNDVAEECGAHGVKGLVVISAGFREVGGDGVERERQLVETVRRHGMRMLGPNCMGVINTDPAVSMNGTFAPLMPPGGKAAFVSQSGALGVSVLDYALELGIGIGQFVSMGNKPDVSGNDLLLQWENDPAVELILMYAENFGNPRRFLEIATRITPHKPIVAVKAGRSAIGARAASSHTGALAANDSSVDALLKQAGVLRARSVEELFDIAMALSVLKPPRGKRTVVITNSGGPGVLAADALGDYNVDLVDFQPETVARLAPLYPPEASIRNPLDMIASANAQGYRAALDAILEDSGVDMAVAIFTPPLGVRTEEVAEAIGAAAIQHPTKPVVSVLMGRAGLPQGKAELMACGVPAYVFPESAARAVGALVKRSEWLRRPERAIPDAAALSVNRDDVRDIIASVRARRERKLSEAEALAVLDAYGIPTVCGKIATSADDAATIAADVGWPVVLKIISPQVVHKTEVGGVRLNLSTPAEVRLAFDEIIESARRAAPDAHTDGVLVQKQIASGRELIAGITRQPGFGSLVMAGLGGVFVEVLRDVTFRLAPIDTLDASDMLSELRGASMLDAIRGQPAVDRNAIVDILVRVARLGADFPEIEELDINPLVASSSGATAVDARVLLTASGG